MRCSGLLPFPRSSWVPDTKRMFVLSGWYITVENVQPIIQPPNSVLLYGPTLTQGLMHAYSTSVKEMKPDITNDSCRREADGKWMSRPSHHSLLQTEQTQNRLL